jgi:hypothetical protein
MVPSGDVHFGNAPVGGVVDAYAYGRVGGPDASVRAALTLRLRVVSRTGTAPGSTARVAVVSSTPLVAENGRSVPGFAAGRQMEVTLR